MRCWRRFIRQKNIKTKKYKNNDAMRIKIDYVAKSEGHAGLEAQIINGDVSLARMDVKDGARLIEGILVGRKIEEVPLIVSRICGVCPVVHNISSIKALEAALGLKIPKHISTLRKLISEAQVVQSHTLHLFYLALSDYFGVRSSIDFSKKHRQEYEKVTLIRDYVNELINVIGGRAVHPTASVIGGFLKAPEKRELEDLFERQPKVLQAAVGLLGLFKKIKLPEFSRESEYIAMSDKNEYALYDGDLTSTHGLHVPVARYTKELKEFERASKVVKLVKHDDGPYMVGALARINLNGDQLHPEAKKALRTLSFKVPNYNTFYNLFGQMVEVIHCIEESKLLLEEALASDLGNCRVPYRVKAGKGVGGVEAPRGLLIHGYEINKEGRVVKADVITPTAQFLFNLDKDLEALLPAVADLNSEDRRQKIKMLVRAYDLCISCAVH